MKVETQQLSVLAAQLEKVDRQNRWLRRGMLVGLFVTVAATAVGHGRPTRGQTTAEPNYRDSILLGPRTLSLGMPETEVLRTLKTDYVLQKAPMAPNASDQVWIVCKQRSADDCPAEVIFVQGKLESVDLRRGPEDDAQGAAFADVAYYAFADMVREGRRECIIDADLRDSEHIVTKTASIRCGPKYIDIHITEVKGTAPSAWVAEGLGPQR